MKFPKYSILYFNHPLTQHQKELGQFLKEGKKVFWFGSNGVQGVQTRLKRKDRFESK